MSSGDRRVCMCCVCFSVYWRASAGLSIHVNRSKTPEGADVWHAACVTLKKMGKLNERTDVFDKLAFKSSEGFKSNMPVWKYTHTRTHCSGKIWHIRQKKKEEFCLACKMPRDSKTQNKKGQSAKKKYDLLDFFSALYFTLSSSHCKWNPIRFKRPILLQFCFNDFFFHLRYRWTLSSSNLILKELKMYLQHLLMHCVCKKTRGSV